MRRRLPPCLLPQWLPLRPPLSFRSSAPAAMATRAAWVALMALASPAARAGPVAILTEVAGDVRFERGGHAVELAPVVSIEAGTLLTLAPNARAVLAYTNGGSIYELEGEGRFVARAGAVQRIGASGSLHSRNLPAAFRALRIHADVESLQGGAGMRGADDSRLQARGPTGRRSSMDTLAVCWTPLGPQWKYQLRLVDGQGRLLFEDATAGTRMALPPAAQLETGTSYVWQLVASAPYGRSAEATGRFERIGEALDRALMAAADLAGNAGSTPTERRLYALALHQHGLESAPGRVDCARP